MKKILILILLSFAVYSNSLFNFFVWDDTDVIQKQVFSKVQKNPLLMFSTDFYKTDYPFERYRPLWSLSLFTDYKVWGLRPFGFHLTNILFHTANVLLVYFLIFLILKDKNISLFSAILFAIHPVHTETVTYMKNRYDLLATFFFLLSFISFIKFEEFRKDIKFIVLSVLFFAFSVLSKEIGIVLPAIIVFYILLMKKGRIKDTIPLWTIAIVFTAFEFLFIITNKTVKTGPDVIALLMAAGEYIKMNFIPWVPCVERNFTFSIGSVIFLIVYVAAIYYLFRKKKFEHLFFLIFFITALMPIINVNFVGTRQISEGRVYLPSVGLAIFCGIIINRALQIYNKKIITAIFLSVILILSLLTFKRNFDFKDSLTLWRKTVKQNSQSARAWNNLGAAFEQSGQFEKAIISYKMAIGITPDIQFYENLTIAYIKLGKLDEATDVAKKIAEIDSNNNNVHRIFGTIYEKKGDFNKAIYEYEKFLQKKSRDYAAYNSLGIIHAKLSNYAEAEKNYRKSVEIFPDFKEGWINLGMLYYKQKKYKESLEYIEKARKIDEDDIEILNKISIIYDTVGKTGEAIEILRKITSIYPGYIPAHYNLAEIYMKKNMHFEALAELKSVLDIDSQNKSALQKKAAIEKLMKNE